MGGFFVDGLVFAIARGVRRSVRRSSALKWALADGTVTRFQAQDEVWNQFRPVVDYTYALDGETRYGRLTGFPLDRRIVDEVGEALDRLPALKVRFDPTDRSQSRVLNEDNSKLPFEVDLNEGV